MRAVEYAFRHAWAGFWRGKVSTGCAVLAIALAASVLGGLMLVTANADQVLGRWRDSAEFSVFFRDDATSEQRGVVEGVLDQSGMVGGRAFVSKDEALVRFRQEFAELASLASELPGNPFPASLEVRLLVAPAAGDAAETLLRRVATLPGVSDVRYDRAWLERVGLGLETIRGVGFGLVLLLAAAAAVTVASVVRLGMLARRDEIEIMDLVGASSAYIRGPFVAEGLLQGGVGACIALVLVLVGYRTGMAVWGEGLTVAFDGLAPRFLSLGLCWAIVLGGMLVGSLGGAIASRR